jgi:hypothetical protein
MLLSLSTLTASKLVGSKLFEHIRRGKPQSNITVF